jgi:hypothetical protein
VPRITKCPHHNLYYLVSDSWDLEMLGGLLLSRITQLFIEAYCVSEALAERLRTAFGNRDADVATKAAIEAYDIAEFAESLGC